MACRMFSLVQLLEEQFLLNSLCGLALFGLVISKFADLGCFQQGVVCTPV